jgi:hypothetical protein
MKILLPFIFFAMCSNAIAQQWGTSNNNVLGSNTGNNLSQTSVGGRSSNWFFQNTWLMRFSPGSDWYTACWVDGISIDASFSTPTTAKTWWRRDPVSNTQSWGTEGLTFMTLASGNLGIGTMHPDKTLTVNGPIHCKEVQVDVNIPVPDYVFQKSYSLPDLKSVEKYVAENKHLEGIPSAKEMEENGLNLKEMNLLLLKKIEELTLYVIDQQKQIDELKAKK